MKRSVYIKAAKLVANGGAHYCCVALWQSGTWSSGLDYIVYEKYEKCFRYMFKCKSNSNRLHGYWGSTWVYKNQLARSLALLLMAEICEDL